MAPKLGNVLSMSGTVDFHGKIENIDSEELGQRLKIPESWVRAHTQPRCPENERIPHLRLGRYIRFRWGSPELEKWIADRVTR